MSDAKIEAYLKAKLDTIAVQEFLAGVTLEELTTDTDLVSAEAEVETMSGEA